jgi:hypothetical protein
MKAILINISIMGVEVSVREKRRVQHLTYVIFCAENRRIPIPGNRSLPPTLRDRPKVKAIHVVEAKVLHDERLVGWSEEHVDVLVLDEVLERPRPLLDRGSPRLESLT